MRAGELVNKWAETSKQSRGWKARMSLHLDVDPAVLSRFLSGKRATLDVERTIKLSETTKIPLHMLGYPGVKIIRSNEMFKDVLLDVRHLAQACFNSPDICEWHLDKRTKRHKLYPFRDQGYEPKWNNVGFEAWQTPGGVIKLKSLGNWDIDISMPTHRERFKNYINLYGEWVETKPPPKRKRKKKQAPSETHPAGVVKNSFTSKDNNKKEATKTKDILPPKRNKTGDEK